MSRHTRPRFPDPVRRDLANRPIRRLGRLVERAPALVVAAVIAVTIGLLVVSGQAQDAAGDEGMMPDLPEVDAFTTLGDRFNGGGDAEIVQILVTADGGTLVGADGMATAAAIEDVVRGGPAGDRIADTPDRPGVISWMTPAQAALQETGSAGEGALDDATVAAAYEAGLDAMPPEQAGLATSLYAGTAGNVDRALVLVFLDTEGLAADWATYAAQMDEIQVPMAEDVAAADLPDGIAAAAFSEFLLFSDSDAFDAEISRLFGSAFAIIVVILGFVYWVRPGLGMSRLRAGRRSAADMLLSMATIVMAILWMTGAAVLLGPGYLDWIGGMTEFTQVIPILLIGLGVDYAIHLTSRYREEVGAGASVDGGVRGAIATVGGALVLATVTTAVGFMTNVFNPIPALQDFGVLSAVGIVSAFVLMLTFVPAMRLMLDRRAERKGQLPQAALARNAERLLPGIMARTAVLADKAPIPTLAVTLVLAGLGVFGMSQLETRFANTDFVPTGTPELETLEELEEHFAGGFGETTDVLVTGDVATPAAHNALVEVHTALADIDDVVVHGRTAAAHSPITLLGQLLSGGADGEPVPATLADAAAAAGLGEDLTVSPDADVAALYAAMALASPDAAGEVLASAPDGSFDHARISVQTTAGDEGADDLRAAMTTILEPLELTGVAAVATSQSILWKTIIHAIEDSQVSSLAITLLVAMLLLVAVFAYEQRRPLLGVITIVPVVLVVLWTFGMMHATGIPFGPITATIAALAIGIGLPYAIHVTHRFTEDRNRHADVGEAVRSTVRHTGGAMAGSAFTTMAGFGILVTSSMLPFRQLGAVTVYAVGFSLLAATLVLPSMLVLWDRWHRRRDLPAEPHDDAVPVLVDA